MGPGISPPRDGDVYRVTVIDESDNIVATVNEMATYALSRPNGPDCDPECHHAVIGKAA